MTALEKYPMSDLFVNTLFDDLPLGSCLKSVFNVTVMNRAML